MCCLKKGEGTEYVKSSVLVVSKNSHTFAHIINAKVDLLFTSLHVHCIFQKIMTKCEEANVKLDVMVDALDNASIDLQNVNNK